VTAKVVIGQTDPFEPQVAHGVVPGLLDAPPSPGIDLGIGDAEVLRGTVELEDRGVLQPGAVDANEGDAIEVVHPDLRLRERNAPFLKPHEGVGLQPRLSATVHDAE
jgi:hypothetical protein